MRTVKEAFAAIDALVLGGNNRQEEEALGQDLKAFIQRQAAGMAAMGAALATPSNSVDECSGEAADIAARTASETMARCLTALVEHGPMIAERVAVVAGVPSAAKRLSDAFKAGWVEKVGKAPNAAGRNANLYGITELGRDMFGIES
jgi:hypothetical protein